MKIKDNLKELLKKEDVVEFGYIFGSYVDGSFTNSSDVDLALYLKKDLLDVRLELIYRLSKELKKDVDLVVLNSVKNIYLLDNILQNAEVIKDSDKRVDFELRKEHEILDYKAFKDLINVA